MKNNFSIEEKRKFMLKKHLKDHLFEYILDILGPLIITIILLYLCESGKFIYGIILSLAYSIGRTVYNIFHYKKVYIDVDIK